MVCDVNSIFYDIIILLLIEHKIAKYRNAWNSTLTFIPFEIEVFIPKPRKERVITERDKKGRIVHSKVGEIVQK